MARIAGVDIPREKRTYLINIYLWYWKINSGKDLKSK